MSTAPYKVWYSLPAGWWIEAQRWSSGENTRK